VFWFVGDGPLRAEIQQRAEQLGCAPNIRFPGFRADVADLMSSIDIMALPSHKEPFGLVYVEAGLLAKPVIACRAGGAPEVVIEGQTGLVVPPCDEPALAEAICALVEDRDFAHRLGRRGQEQALERYGWGRYLDGLDAIYADL
jgi:glycosyltransferase involved in cell wall biosynthesis